MTNNNHPITPSPELVGRWLCSEDYFSDGPNNSTMTITRGRLQNVATQAAQWGSDQELDACCEWLQDPDLNVDTYKLRAARRPKPPSLKAQALDMLDRLERCTDGDYYTIRCALESLPK